MIFKKYSPIGELEPYTKQYADVLYRTTGLPVVICDRDHIIAAAGVSKKQVLDKRISPELERAMESRSTFVASRSDTMLPVCEDAEKTAAIMVPILGGGDVMGAVLVLGDDLPTPPGPTEEKLVQVAAGFLGKQMEE